MPDQIELNELLYLENGNWTTHGQQEECERDHNTDEKNDIHRFFCPPSLNRCYHKWDSIKNYLISYTIGWWIERLNNDPPSKGACYIGY